MNRFTLTPAQWKRTGVVSVLSSLGVLVISGVLASTASDDGATVLIAIILGLTIGTLTRSSVKRGWAHASGDGLQTTFNWTPRRRFGIAWRSLVLFFAGQALISLLDHFAWSDGSQLMLMLLALLVITETAILVGLRFGWHQASSVERVGGAAAS
jgi:hypothetical protein